MLDERCSFPTTRGNTERQKLVEKNNTTSLLLFDDGGFKEGDWEGFLHIFDSPKKTSPIAIGRYGMGSRSYFYYTDVLSVVSGTRYQVLDPLSHCFKRGGSEIDLADGNFSRENPDEVEPLKMPAFGCSMEGSLKGSLFRIPLRTQEDASAEHPYAPGTGFSSEQAESHLFDFIAQIQTGNLLHFLTSVEKIEVWHWKKDDKEPTCHASISVTDDQVFGEKFARLPALLPEDITNNFKELHAHIKSMSESSFLELVDASSFWSERTMALTIEGKSTKSRWLVGKKLYWEDDFLSKMLQCCALPLAGVSLPLDAVEISAKAFCYLPLPIETFLPLHINSSFLVFSNRRSLWLGQDATQEKGFHKTYVLWNRLILDNLIPRLYTDAIQMGLHSFSFDFETVCRLCPTQNVLSPWDAIASSFYKLLINLPVIPSSGKKVAPKDCATFLTPTEALKMLRSSLFKQLTLVEKVDDQPIVDIPQHVQVGLKITELPILLLGERLLSRLQQVQPWADLWDFMLALAEYLSQHIDNSIINQFTSSLKGLAWVRVSDSKMTTSDQAFLPWKYDNSDGLIQNFKISKNSIVSVPLQQSNTLRIFFHFGV
eukprot:Lithocolla_globosa_v1_NODE_795_length_3271_cov_34.496269.p1 type:complete len:599 gc:universal NODE_795_length_3271_cov_34.496269:488-2284(+)